jgi:uncharacterized protein YqeY
MTLSQKVDSDLTAALRSRDTMRLAVLRMLKAALKYATTEKRGADGELDDAEAIQVIRKQIKQRRDSIEHFEKGGRTELAAQEKAEVEILSEYLPPMMSADEMVKIVRETIAEVGATSKAQLGAVMKALGPKAGALADGKTLSQEVQRQLGP